MNKLIYWSKAINENTGGAFFATQGLSERIATESKVRSWTVFSNKNKRINNLDLFQIMKRSEIMIPQKPEILKAPLVVDGEKNILPETTPQGSNQFSLLGGFPTLTSLPVNAGGLPPKRLDFNAVFNLLSIHTFFLQSGNKYSWSSELDYSIGGVVLASNNSIYLCIKANGATPPNTVKNPVTSTGYWVEVVKSNGTINIDLIATGAISTNKIANGAITSDKLADNAVTSAKIADGTIVNADIANTTITGSKLANSTVTANHLANNAVTNAKIANSAVDNNKISGVAASKVSGLATVAKTGSYNDLLNKPAIPTNAAPMPTNNTNIVGGYRVFANPMPAGGTWAYCFFSWNGAGNPTAPSSPWAGIVAGGTVLDTGASVGWSGFCWRIQ